VAWVESLVLRKLPSRPTCKNVIEASIRGERILCPNVLTGVKTRDSSDADIEVVPLPLDCVTLFPAKESHEVTRAEDGPDVSTTHPPARRPNVTQTVFAAKNAGSSPQSR
jgi:hypothetical protein